MKKMNESQSVSTVLQYYVYRNRYMVVLPVGDHADLSVCDAMEKRAKRSLK